jgi:hypothetical protein
MPFPDLTPYADAIGYLGAVITIGGLFQRTMIPLRVGAIAGNIAFIAFGILAQSYPTLILHSILLPLNSLRLWQMLRLIREIRMATHETNSLDPLLPFMHRGRRPAGSILFRRGDRAEGMIVIQSGSIRIEEFDILLGAGDVLGEIAAFTPENRRTGTAVCETDCELYELSNDAMLQLFYQNPRFAMYLVRLIVQRLLQN